MTERLFDKDVDAGIDQGFGYRQVGVRWSADKGRVQILILYGLGGGTIKRKTQAHTVHCFAKRSVPVHQGDYLGLWYVPQNCGVRQPHSP
jgi:hypothetical protein